MTRYTVWACFGVDADSPKEAKKAVNEMLSTKSSVLRTSLRNKHRINAVVYLSPELDKLLDEIEEE